MIAVHLLRHAHAGDPERWTEDDSRRPLSEKGRRQAERLGRLLAGLDEAPDLFITSPKVRAAQTAELVADAARRPGGRRPAARPAPLDIAVARGCPPGARRRGAAVPRGPRPRLQRAARATSSASRMVPMRKGAIARVDVPTRDLVPGRGVLRYLLPPDVVPGK